MYPSATYRVLTGAINLLTDTIKAALLSDAYVYNSADEYYSDVSANVLGSPVTLTGKSVANGAFDADNVAFTGEGTGNTAALVMLYKDTGNPATSPLIQPIYIFPYVTDGTGLTVVWNNGASKIFSVL